RRGKRALALHRGGALVERPRRHRAGSARIGPRRVLDSRATADPSSHEEGADLGRGREEGLARHRHVEGEVVPADATEADLDRAVSFDDADELSARHAEDASAGSAITDGSVGLHRALLPGIAVDHLGLADDSRADAERTAVGSPDHDDIVADLRIVGLPERYRGKYFADLENREVLGRDLALEAPASRDAPQRGSLDDYRVRRSPLDAVARNDVLVGEDEARAGVVRDHHAGRGPGDLARDRHLDAHALDKGLL